MATLADIKKAAEANSEGNVIVSTFVDHATPAGHFGAVAIVLGITTVYLLEGVQDDANAVIKGRIELPSINEAHKKRSVDYSIGGNLKGGTWGGLVHSTEEAFAKMV